MTQRQNIARECVRILAEQTAELPGQEDLRAVLDSPELREPLLTKYTDLMLELAEKEAGGNQAAIDRALEIILTQLSNRMTEVSLAEQTTQK
jgi:hypothetical protein